MVISRKATLEDLEKYPNLNEEGETVWETLLEITHCPYCGIYLPEADHPKYQDCGLFVHNDQSEWKYKIQ